MLRQILIIVALCVAAKTAQSLRPTVIRQSRYEMVRMATEKFEDPNFEAHLPTMMEVGRDQNRPDPDIAKKLRDRFKKMENLKRAASAALKKTATNVELAIELEELADEFAETQEKFGKISLCFLFRRFWIAFLWPTILY